MTEDDDLDAQFGYVRHQTTLDDILEAVQALELRHQHDATQIKVALFWIALGLCYLIYRLS